MKQMLIMIAGPYKSSAKTEAEQKANLDAMNKAAYEVFRKGHIPVLGVNNALPVIEVIGDEKYDELMMPISLGLAERCDAVLRIGGESKGADREVALIESNGGVVYRSIEEVPKVV